MTALRAPGARKRWQRPRAVAALLWADAATVRVRTTAAAMLVVGLALSGSAAGLVVLLGGRLDEQLSAAAVARSAEAADALRMGVLPENLTAGSAGSADDRFLQVLDGGGRMVAASPGARALAVLTPADAGRTVRLRHPFADGGDFVVAVRTASTPAGRLTVLAGVSREDASDSVRLTAGLLAIGLVPLLLVVGMTTWFVTGRTLAPVEAIRSEVDAISARELHRRVAVAGRDDEVGRLAATMNRMLERLERAQQQQRRFVSDASHELRSPVATIRQHAEVALAHPGRTNVPELAATVLEEDRRIERLVADLLLLARADEAADGAGHTPVDLDDVVLDHAARVRAAGRVEVDLSGVSAGRVEGSRSLLDRLVGNLVENAARHARSRIALTLTHVPGQQVAGQHADGQHADGGPPGARDREAGVVVLCVDDDGPGIPEPDRQRVFERFVRLDGSRHRETGGAGLGLAIAAEVVRVHGGSIRAGRSGLGGARLEVALPASAD